MFDPLTSPYEVRDEEFPRAAGLADQMRFLLRHAILAPSTHNTQPWLFGLTPEGIDVFADFRRRMPVVDPGSRELYISVGAAVFNLRVAAAWFGMPCVVEYTTSGDSERPLASVRLAPAGSPGMAADRLSALFPHLVGRHTNRNPYLASRVPESVTQKLQDVAAHSSVEVSVSLDGQVNGTIANLVGEAVQELWGDPSFRQDLADWVRPEAAVAADGLTAEALGWSGMAASAGTFAARSVDQGRAQAARDRNLCLEAPGLMVLASEDSVAHWLETGEVLEHLLLTIMAEGLQYSYFNMPVQRPASRAHLKSLLDCSAWPQLLLRIGYCLKPPARTPRRPLEEFLVGEGRRGGTLGR